MENKKLNWNICYKKAIADDGTLLFPEKLTKEFLEIQKRKLGSYSFSQQYQNEIIPEDLQSFRKDWFKYTNEIPKNVFNYAIIDPAIGQKKTSDFTGLIVLSVDSSTNWYVRVAKRERMTPTQIVNMCFEVHKQFDCLVIGLEIVAFQEALMYMLSEEMQRRKTMIPVKGYRPPNDRTKQARIRSLVPRYEFGRIYHVQGLYDLETELLQFPLSSHDDLCDPLSAIEEMITYPEEEKPNESKPNSAADPRYEKWFIANRLKTQTQKEGT